MKTLLNWMSANTAAFVARLGAQPAAAPTTPIARSIGLIAVGSRIGDTVSRITLLPDVGNHPNQNRYDSYVLPDARFDLVATQSIRNAIAPLNRAIAVHAVEMRESDASAEALLTDATFNPGATTRSALEAMRATHLLLLTKHRAPSRFKTGGSSQATCDIEGFGFCVDRSQPVKRRDTGERGLGFLAPFAYFRLSLIELSSSNVIASQVATAGMVLSAARNKKVVDPWDVLDAREKSIVLERMIRAEVSRLVPRLLSNSALRASPQYRADE
jgi:hypothetical protein